MSHATTKYIISEPGGSFLASDCDSYAWDCRVKSAKVYHGRVEALTACDRTERAIEKRIGRFVQLTVKPRGGGAPVVRSRSVASKI